MTDIKQHRRVNDILLGPLERPVLKWLAAHMPTWITPDVCTAIGVLGAFGVGISYILSIYNKNFLWLASIGFFLNWFGDSLDGTLARHRHIERPIFGFFVDVLYKNSDFAESADVREKIEVVERDLESLHTTHREPRHRAMIAVGKRAEGGIDEGDQRLGDIVFKRRSHVLHSLQHFWGTDSARRPAP